MQQFHGKKISWLLAGEILITQSYSDWTIDSVYILNNLKSHVKQYENDNVVKASQG